MSVFLIFIVVVFLLVFPGIFLFAYASQKMSADLQARVGVNRSGPAGVLQPLADVIKLMQKGGVIAENREVIFWWLLYQLVLYSTVIILPLGSVFIIYDSEMSVLIPLWISVILSFSVLLMSLSQGTGLSVLSGLRRTSQTMASVFPAIVSLLCAAFKSGGFRWSDASKSQGFLPFFWTAFSSPFEFLAFLIFILSGMMLFAISPVDVDQECSSFMSGRILGFHKLAKYYGYFLWCLVTVAVFLGAWNLPAGLQGETFLEVVWILSKVFFLMLLVHVVARSNPVGRVDQTTDFSWRVLSPFSLVALIGSSIWIYFGD